MGSKALERSAQSILSRVPPQIGLSTFKLLLGRLSVEEPTVAPQGSSGVEAGVETSEGFLLSEAQHLTFPSYILSVSPPRETPEAEAVQPASADALLSAAFHIQ